MQQMTTDKLFEEGNYMVISLHPEVIDFDERKFFLWNLRDQVNKVDLSNIFVKLE